MEVGDKLRRMVEELFIRQIETLVLLFIIRQLLVEMGQVWHVGRVIEVI